MPSGLKTSTPPDGTKDSATAAKSLAVVALECKKETPGSDLLFFYTGSEDEELVKSLRTFAKIPNKTPQADVLALVDIPNQKKYVSDAKEIDEKAVRDMVKGYNEGSLQGEPLK